MRIATSSNRPQLTEEMMEKIETFVSEIQLYGTPHQIQLMTKIVEEFKKPNNIVSFDALLADLRDTIRKELKLESVSGAIWWLRLNRVSDGKTATTPLSSGPPRGSGDTVS